MKKSLLALAALTALAGTAQAQSAVTLYGLIDLNLTSYSAGSNSGAASVTKMNDGVVNGLNGSRWGIRTSEDLGGGLAVGVVMESGLSADTGAAGQGGLAFGRQIFVSMSSKTAGEFRAGRQYVLSDSVMGQGDPTTGFGNALVNNPSTSVTDKGKNLPYFLNPSRANNVLHYETPSFDGLTAAVQYAPGEGTADNYQGLRAVYSKAPFYLGAAYEWNKDRTTGNSSNKALTVSTNYDFGSFKLTGGLQHSTDLTTTSGNGTASGVSNLTITGNFTPFTLKNFNGYNLGVEVPVSAATTVGLNYVLMKYEGALGETSNVGKIALSARYALSKTTYLYTGVSMATGDLKDYLSEKTVVQLGMRKAF
jgi:predicted porin